MKNFKFNKKRICAIVLTGFILITTCSCGKSTVKYEKNDSSIGENTTQSSETNSTNNDNFIEQNDINSAGFKVEIRDEEKVEKNSKKDYTTSEVVENSQTGEVIENNENNSQIIYSEEDNVIIEEFTSIKNKVVEYLNSDKVENAKEKSKGVFISIVDFLFYEGEIKGIKFNDLTEEGKKKVLGLATDVDSCIMKKFPTYKEDIAETTKQAYEKASELIKKGASNIKEFSKEKLGEENYNAIVDAKDDLVGYTKDAFEIVGNVSSKLWDSTKEKIKNWYEGFRNS